MTGSECVQFVRKQMKLFHRRHVTSCTLSKLLLICASAKFRGDLPNGLKVEMHTHLVNFISYSL